MPNRELKVTDSEQCCGAGLRTIADALRSDVYAPFVVRGMINSAQQRLDESPDIGVRSLADQLTSDVHYEQHDDVPVFVWGPVRQMTPEEHASRNVVDGVPTWRVALAVATCATRGCGIYEKCIAKGGEE